MHRTYMYLVNLYVNIFDAISNGIFFLKFQLLIDALKILDSLLFIGIYPATLLNSPNSTRFFFFF